MASSSKASSEEKYYMASQRQLMWRKFKRHKLALVGLVILGIFYGTAIFADFVATHDVNIRNTEYIYAPPQKIHFFDNDGNFHLRPFVYNIKMKKDMENLRRIYTEDTGQRNPIYLFVKGDAYSFWGLFESEIRLFGPKEGPFFLFGTDGLGRDLFSRTLHAARISLSIGLVGVFFSFVLGCLFGGIAGYYGGFVDVAIQRSIEFLLAIPLIPLWMGLAAAVPAGWPPVKVYLGITIVLSLVGWTHLARVVRGKIISLREQDFVLAARLCGARERFIITRHLLPALTSYLVVSLTLAIPQMIIGETALSFLGLGLQPPAVSWGVLLKDAQSLSAVALHPWLLIPAVFVVLAVLGFNFVGDGVRDAADPYKN